MGRYMLAFVGYVCSNKYVTVKHYALYFEVAALQKLWEKTVVLLIFMNYIRG